VAVTVFPLLILAAALIGFLAPDVGQVLAPGTNVYLGIIMFAMGLTLTIPDFALVVKRPLPVLIGVVAQYLIMPLLGFAIARVLQLDPLLAAGVILVGCAPGGTASNVISYLSKADTALSVTMTSISTLIAPIMTPLLTLALAGQYMPVAAGDMALTIVKIVLIPVLAGLVIRLLLSNLVDKVLPALVRPRTEGPGAFGPDHVDRGRDAELGSRCGAGRYVLQPGGCPARCGLLDLAQPVRSGAGHVLPPYRGQAPVISPLPGGTANR
jgi:predicted Na+-dependent transporter